MCSENKKIHIAYIVLVCLMAALLFSITVLNHGKLSNLEKIYKNKNEVCSSMKFNRIEKLLTNLIENYNCSVDKNFFKEIIDNHKLEIKNELSKISLKVIISNEKIIKLLEDINRNRNGEEETEIFNKLTNLEEIVERIYDYSALNENSRINDNYNFYNVVKSQVMNYFDLKINDIINKIVTNGTTKC